MALRAVKVPFSRSRPAGKAMPACKNTQPLRTQKVLLRGQPCAWDRKPSAEPYAYSKTLMVIKAIHGRYTMILREWAGMSRSVSPMR